MLEISFQDPENGKSETDSRDPEYMTKEFIKLAKAIERLLEFQKLHVFLGFKRVDSSKLNLSKGYAIAILSKEEVDAMVENIGTQGYGLR